MYFGLNGGDDAKVVEKQLFCKSSFMAVTLLIFSEASVYRTLVFVIHCVLVGIEDSSKRCLELTM